MLNMELIVREATLDDVPVLKRFEQGLIRAERPMDPTIQDGAISYYDVSDFILSDDAALYVVEKEGRIVASGYVKIKPDRHYLKHQHQGYMGFMYVPDEERGQGYNRMIIEALSAWCRKRNIFEARLDVYDCNLSAIKAYEKAGFKPHLLTMRMDLRKE